VIDMSLAGKFTGKVIMPRFTNVPMSSSGLSAGDLWNDGGVIIYTVRPHLSLGNRQPANETILPLASALPYY
jgi:hypothetical protein